MVTSSAVKSGAKELKTNWPITEGLTAGTQKQAGTKMNLTPDEDDLVPQKDRVGLLTKSG